MDWVFSCHLDPHFLPVALHSSASRVQRNRYVNSGCNLEAELWDSPALKPAPCDLLVFLELLSCCSTCSSRRAHGQTGCQGSAALNKHCYVLSIWNLDENQLDSGNELLQDSQSSQLRLNSNTWYLQNVLLYESNTLHIKSLLLLRFCVVRLVLICGPSYPHLGSTASIFKLKGFNSTLGRGQLPLS